MCMKQTSMEILFSYSEYQEHRMTSDRYILQEILLAILLRETMKEITTVLILKFVRCLPMLTMQLYLSTIRYYRTIR